MSQFIFSKEVKNVKFKINKFVFNWYPEISRAVYFYILLYARVTKHSNKILENAKRE